MNTDCKPTWEFDGKHEIAFEGKTHSQPRCFEQTDRLNQSRLDPNRMNNLARGESGVSVQRAMNG